MLPRKKEILAGENTTRNSQKQGREGQGNFRSRAGWAGTIYTEQMDAEGLGRKLLLTPSGDPAEPLKSRPWVL